MNRKYDTSEFTKVTELLRKYFPGCALTADLITGFPGETDEDQQATLDFLRKIQFSQVHVFPYSRRSGTVAPPLREAYGQQVPARRPRAALP